MRSHMSLSGRRREQTHTEEKAWSDTALSQGAPGATRSCKGQGRDLSQSLRQEPGPADTSMLDFWPPEPREDEFLLF